MYAGKISSRIQFLDAPELNLKPGESISIHVVKHLVGKKWAIGLSGKIFPAQSELDLVPGENIRAIVLGSGRRLTLRIVERMEQINPAIAKNLSQSLPDLVFQSLFRSSFPVNTGLLNKICDLYKRLSAKHKKQNRIAKSLALILEKEISPKSSGLDRLIKTLALLPDEKRKKSRDDLPKESEEIEKILRKRISESAGGDGDPIQVFNHLPGKEKTWLVIPITFKDGGTIYYGSMKILLYNLKLVIDKIVLDLRIGEEYWCFQLRPFKNKIKLDIFCNDSYLRKSTRGKISILLSKLHNHGVEFDDSIYNEQNFDGFSPVWENFPHGVDTYT